MRMPWQSKSDNLASQPTAGELRAVRFNACQEPSCQHYQQPRTGPELACQHQSNVDLGIVASFGDVVEQTAAYTPTGGAEGITAAAKRFIDAVERSESEGGEHSARAAEYLEQLRFEVKHG